MVNYNKKNQPKAALLGLGLDNKDGHKRITKGDNFYLCGGSEETHERMVETTIKFNEKLDSKGKKLEDLSKNEFTDMLSESSE
ncbi:MAG TPA: hypothetical protein QF753_09770 [Victivallales bacterium]|nr:hypothetical protein [Victivallales bacterium]